MEDHLRFAGRLLAQLCLGGGDPFGGRTFDRPYSSELDAAKAQGRRGFRVLLPAWRASASTMQMCAAEGYNFAENTRYLQRGLSTYSRKKQTETGVKASLGHG